MMDWREVAMDGETNLTRPVYMYKDLEFEIRSEEVTPEEVEHCTQCLRERGERIYRVYARRKPEVRSK